VQRGLDYFFARLYPTFNETRTAAGSDVGSDSDETQDPAVQRPQKAGRFWGPLLRLSSNQLVMPSSLSALFALSSAEFFKDAQTLAFDHTWRQDQGGQMMTLFRYHHALMERSQEDRARKVILRLALQEALEKHLRGQRKNSAIHVTEPMSHRLYQNCFARQDARNEGIAGPSRDAPHPDPPSESEFSVWFRNECTLADRYTHLSKELGAGALFFLLDYFTDTHIADGLAKTRGLCAEGIAHLQSLGLCARPDVLVLNDKVEELKGHVRMEFNRVFGGLAGMKTTATASRKRKADTGGASDRVLPTKRVRTAKGKEKGKGRQTL